MGRLIFVVLLAATAFAQQPGTMLQSVVNPSIQVYCDTTPIKHVTPGSTLIVTVHWNNNDPKGVEYVSEQTKTGLGSCWGVGRHMKALSPPTCSDTCTQQFWIKENAGGTFTPFIQYRWAEAGLYSISINELSGQ